MGEKTPIKGAVKKLKSIVFIGSNKSGTSREALNIAKQMGYYTILFTDRAKFLQQREEFPDVHLMIFLKDLIKKESVLNEIKRLVEKGYDVKACLSLVDPFVSIASQLAKELGLHQLSSEALYKMENKTRFRKALKGHSFTPFFSVYDKTQSIDSFIRQTKDHLPLVVKSPESNGSKDVILVNTIDELRKELLTVQKRKTTVPLLVEEYLIGPQYLIEVIVHESKVSIVAIIKQEITNRKRFIITGYQFPAQLKSNELYMLEKSICEIVKTLGLVNGPCHLEMRFVNGEWKLIEINPRISGGAMNQIILHGTGINLVKETIKLNLGKEPSFEKTKFQFVYAHYVIIQRRGVLIKVTGKKRAQRHKGVIDVYIKPRKGKILTPPLSMGDRYAYVLATGETEEEAQRNALNAAKQIRFFLEPM